MRTFSKILALTVLSLWSVPLRAQTGSTLQFVPPLPQTVVVDSAHLLSPNVTNNLLQKILALQAATRSDIAVVTLPTVGEQSVGDVALAIGRQWGVGGQADIGDERRNTGVVVLVVPQSASGPRKSSIQISRGLEGIITDGRAGDMRRAMVVLTRQDRYDEGLTLVVDSLIGAISTGLRIPVALPPDIPAAQVRPSTAVAPRRAVAPQGGSGFSMHFFFLTVLIAVPILLIFYFLQRLFPTMGGRRTTRYESDVYYRPGSAPDRDTFGGSGAFSGGGSSSDNDDG